MQFVDTTPTVENKIVIPRHPIRRQWWYTLEERNQERIAVDKALIGKEILVSQVIVRTGYFFQHNDVSYSDIQEQVDAVLRGQLMKVFDDPRNPFFEPFEPAVNDVSPQAFDRAVPNLASVFGTGIRTRALYQARGNWLHEVYKLEAYRAYLNLRTFWYVDIKDIDSKSSCWLKVVGVKRHVIGKRYPPSGGYGGWENYDEYEPGGLDHCQHQSVYVAEGTVSRKQG